jgi:ParB-like chromosome segregation protein Spo0J
LVLDPFCGCGSTIQAALSCGRHGIALDLSPSATHITANSLLFVDDNAFHREVKKITTALQRQIEPLFSCRYNNSSVIISSIVRSEQAQCDKCLKYFVIIEPHTTTAREKCPFCKERFSTRTQSVTFGPSVIVAVEVRDSWNAKRGELIWLDKNGGALKLVMDEDKVHRQAEQIREHLVQPVPQRLLDLGGRLLTTGSTTIGLLYEDRALCALAMIADRIESISDPILKGKLLLAFTGITTNCSKLYRFREGGGGGPMGAYYVPPIRRELNPLLAWSDKIATIASSLDEISSWQGYYAIVSTQSSDRMDIPSNSIDYVFTDPPYADTMPFGDLNFIWDSWLGAVANHDAEAIGTSWKGRMTAVFKEVYRVLKPGAFCSVCYHDTSEGTWADLLDVMAEAGLCAVFGKDVLYIETTAKSYQQTVADKVIKRDHVVNFVKPFDHVRIATSPSVSVSTAMSTYSSAVRSMVRDFLTESPGATKDRIYDYVIARLMREERLEPHDFEKLLGNVADEVQEPVKQDLFTNREADLFGSHVQSRWYLKETADQIDHAEQAKEDAAAARLSKFIAEYLKKKPELEGVHYSDLFEQYLPVHDKPRRLLADWLVEFFIKTPSGTWRLPDVEEGHQLARLREAGTLRRIKRFANALIEGVTVRDKDRPGSDVDLLEWLRQCRRAGLYDQGKAIYEKGGLNTANLSEEQQIEAEDDYRICARRGSTEEAKPKRRKKRNDEE